MKKRIISAVLCVCILMTCFIAADYVATAVTTDKADSAAPDTYSDVTVSPNLATSNDDALILQAWNWSYKNIESKLDKIASQGFNVIQISPPNEIKATTTDAPVTGRSDNGWWMFYQPAGFQINNSDGNALGKKSELVSMVKAAHARGIRVIADSVVNHMGTNGNEDYSKQNPIDHVTPLAKQFEPEIYNGNLFHYPYEAMTYAYEWTDDTDACTYDLTRRATSNLPDLKTEDPKVQNAIYEYLKELVECGVDGFRFDAAKHIETPSDLAKYKSDFWTNTVNKIRSEAKTTYGKDLMSYGEILNTCGAARKYSYYFPFMKVTDSSRIYGIADAVESGNAAGAIPQNMANGTAAQTVLWNESHDTYADGISNHSKGTWSYSATKRNKIWAAIAARNGITSLYLARPSSDTQKLGVASESDWSKTGVVSAVNAFSNNFAGQGEYLATNGSIAVIGRGSKTQDGGAVLINCSGTSKSASGTVVATMADGSYKDRVSGTSFTVSGGKITSGQIGGTGVAVLYNEPGPTVSATESGTYSTDTKSVSLMAKNVDYATYEYNGSTPVKYTSTATVKLGSAADTAGATYKLTLKGYVNNAVVTTQEYTYTKVEQESEYTITVKTNNVSGWSTTPNVYVWNSSTQDTMAKWPGTAMSGSGGTYTATIPNTFDRIIFNTGNSGKQTVDLVLSGSATYTIKSSTQTNADGKAINEADVKADGPQVPTYYPGQENPTEAPSTQAPTTPVTDPPTTTAPIVTDPVTEPPTTPVVTTAPPTVPPTEAPTVAPTTIQTNYQSGDVNRDNALNIGDVTMIQKALAKLIAFDAEQTYIADYDKDGRTSIKDATKIQYALAKA